jgi:hypothetical protein
MQDNLSNRIYAAKFQNGPTQLTEVEQASLYRLISSRCRQNTKARIGRRVELPLSLWKDYGIYSRVTFVNGEVEYICGQSWTDEMRTLRECVLS